MTVHSLLVRMKLQTLGQEPFLSTIVDTLRGSLQKPNELSLHRAHIHLRGGAAEQSGSRYSDSRHRAG